MPLARRFRRPQRAARVSAAPAPAAPPRPAARRGLAAVLQATRCPPYGPAPAAATTYRPASRRVRIPLRTRPFMVDRTSWSTASRVRTARGAMPSGCWRTTATICWRRPLSGGRAGGRAAAAGTTAGRGAPGAGGAWGARRCLVRSASRSSSRSSRAWACSTARSRDAIRARSGAVLWGASVPDASAVGPGVSGSRGVSGLVARAGAGASA